MSSDSMQAICARNAVSVGVSSEMEFASTTYFGGKNGYRFIAGLTTESKKGAFRYSRKVPAVAEVGFEATTFGS